MIDIDCETEKSLIYKLSLLASSLYSKTELLENKLLEVKNCNGVEETAYFYRNSIFAAMQEMRAVIDELETNTAKKYWPFPTYGEILFSV
jgi:glutamine synthetase